VHILKNIYFLLSKSTCIERTCVWNWKCSVPLPFLAVLFSVIIKVMISVRTNGQTSRYLCVTVYTTQHRNYWKHPENRTHFAVSVHYMTDIKRAKRYWGIARFQVLMQSEGRSERCVKLFLCSVHRIKLQNYIVSKAGLFSSSSKKRK